ncbi:MAG TPA: methyltransferase domain-containing protein [Acidimicrobiia bacterium]|nr:methyltransferase domain-containing protein [Acidimicrobiia bacterium]
MRDRYRPPEFDAERYPPDNLAFWVPVTVRLGRIGRSDNVLDLGCATGGFTGAIAEATGARVVGCDHSYDMLAYARRHRSRPSTSWVQGDAAYAPFGPRSFDRVVASLVIHQVGDRERVLHEVSRVLKRNGVLLIRTVTPDDAAAWIPHRFFPSVAGAQRARMPPIAELTRLLAQAGFSDVGSEAVERARHVPLEDIEASFRTEVADRFPFLSPAELEDGLARLHAHWATEHGDLVVRRYLFLVATKR